MYSDIKAIAFDFGGVMTLQFNRGPIACFLQKKWDLSPTEIAQVFDRMREAKLQKIPFDTFWYNQAAMFKKNIGATWLKELKKVIENCITSDSRMYDLITKLKAKGYKIALLSNVQPHKALILKNLGLYEPFDPLLLSCDTGIVKPSSEAFEQLITALNLQASEIAFIDDKKSNIIAANALGIHGLHFQSYEDLLEKLSQIDIQWI